MALNNTYESARRLARALFSDVELFNAEHVANTKQSGVTTPELAEAIEEAREIFNGRVVRELHYVFDEQGKDKFSWYSSTGKNQTVAGSFTSLTTSQLATLQNRSELENFVLYPDRQAFLRTLVPGSDTYYFFTCLDLQTNGQWEQSLAKFSEWKNRNVYSQLYQEMEARHFLYRYLAKPSDHTDELRQRLGLSFGHQPKQASIAQKLSSQLSETVFDLEALKAKTLRKDPQYGGFTDRSLDWLISDTTDPVALGYPLVRLKRPDHPALIEKWLIEFQFKKRRFGMYAIDRVFHREQLDELVKSVPSLVTEELFVELYIRQLQPNNDVNIDNDPQAYGGYLERLTSFVQTLAPSFNSLKAQTYYHGLVYDRRCGAYNLSKFIKYLAIPRAGSLVDPGYQNLPEHRNVMANLAKSFQPVTMLDPVDNEEALVRDYLFHFLSVNPDIKPFRPFVRDTVLKEICAEAQLLTAKGNEQRWVNAWSDPTHIQTLRERVDLEFAYDHKTLYRGNDEVVLKVFTKNIPTLIVKIFEINAFNYYTQQQQELTTTLDLDGLIASEEHIVHYDDPPLKRSLRTFQFETLKKPGLYIVDFLGGGKSSRALVRKGSLRSVQTSTATGHRFHVVDEDGAVQKDAVIWLEQRSYHANTEGVVEIPFTTTPKRQNIILSAASRVSLDSFEHARESYGLTAGIFVDRESLVKQKQATIIVRPTLTVNQKPISVALLQNVSLSIVCADQQGISSSKTVEPFDLSDTAESTFTFQVPAELSDLTCILKGEVQSLSEGKKIELSSAQAFQINTIERTDTTKAYYLYQTEHGYHVQLLGKTGEPCAEVPTTVELQHQYFTDTVDAVLQTDENGKIFLGKLLDITHLKVTSSDGVSAQWRLDTMSTTLPNSINASENEVIHVPFKKQDGTRSEVWEHVSLLERNIGGYRRNLLERVRIVPGMIEISGLSPGSYELYLKDLGRAIEIQVTKGISTPELCIGSCRILERKRQRPVGLVARSTEHGLEIIVPNFTKYTRVHVVAHQFCQAADFRLFDRLARYSTPPVVHSIELPESAYVSGRDIGDEYRYVLDRKYAKKYPGNLLKRAGLLLNPWALRPAVSKRESISFGGGYEENKKRGGRAEAAQSAPRAKISKHSQDCPMDFLVEPSLVLSNLQLDGTGKVVVEASRLSGYRMVTVLAVQTESTTSLTIALGEKTLPIRDLRCTDVLPPNEHFTEQKSITVLTTGQSVTMDDGATAKFEVYDSMARVYSLLSSLNNDSNFSKFRFVLDWAKKTESEKCALYSEYACHELHFFLWRKDREFFDRVVKPYLAHKREKQFLDHFFLGNDLSRYARPWAFSQLNVVEKILFAQAVPALADSVVRYIQDILQQQTVDYAAEQRLYLAALRSNALEAPKPEYARATTTTGTTKEAREREGGGRASVVMAGLAPAAPMAALGLKGGGGPATMDGMAGEVAEESRAESFGGMPVTEQDEADPNIDAAEVRIAREAMRPLFRKLDPTQELVESHYYRLSVEEQSSDRVSPNGFWLDFAKHKSATSFLSRHVTQATRNFTEMMFALSAMDLPWDSQQQTTDFDGVKLTVTAQSPLVMYHKELKTAGLAKERLPILAGQNYFRKDDRYRYEGQERFDKYVDEFLVRVVYVCQVVVTNTTSAEQRLDLLLQIPQGAIAVNNGFTTKGVKVTLGAYATTTVEYSFYFPYPGEFSHYPVHVSKNEQVMAFAESSVLTVVEKPVKVDKQSWAYVSQWADASELFEFLKTNNLERLDLEQIAWRMNDRHCYEKIMEILQSRHCYRRTLWGYAIYHQDLKRVGQFLEYEDTFLRSMGQKILFDVIATDCVERRWYSHREFAPLVNARTHPLGKNPVILNMRLMEQFQVFLSTQSYEKERSHDDELSVVYYLLLQDRIEEALATFAKIDRSLVTGTLQYDYLRCYLAFFGSHPEEALAIAEQYRTYPVDRWRNLFLSVVGQLEEVQGAHPTLVDQQERSEQHDQLVATEPSLDVVIEQGKVIAHYENIDSFTVNFYRMDIELLFSRQPFVQQQSKQFSFVKANKTVQVRCDSRSGQQLIQIPDELASTNVIIEVVSGALRKPVPYYANKLNVRWIETYGQVQVRDAESLMPLSRVYVKVYARTNGGSTVFVKDGYTDIRGRFDYVSVSNNILDQSEKLAVLITSEQHGALIREVQAPSS